MHNLAKEWLVRTKNREVLGPFTQKELIEELNKKSFSVEDEIASIGGLWVSAQSLWNRDSDEVTHTSTRNQTFTGSVTSGSGPNTISLSHAEDLTPTPDVISVPPQEKPRKPFTVYSNPQNPQGQTTPRSKAVPIVTGAVVLLLTFAVFLKLGERSERPVSNMHSLSSAESDSPFVQEIYQLIHSGETGTALRKLTEYHERGQKKDELGYLIPYSALLITEGESVNRARKFLELILNASTATPQLKSRAHHWLGYLLLSQDEGDMGESHFLEALQLNPKDAAARFNLGRAYLKQEKYSQALDYLQLAELEMPDLWLVHIYKGRAKVALGNMEEAKSAFKTAIQVSPDRWITYIYFALYLVGVRDYEEARTTLRKMLTRDPQYEFHAPAPLGFYQERVNYSEYLNAYSHVMEKGTAEEKELGRLYINYLMNGAQEEDFRRFELLAEKGPLLTKVIALKILLDRKISATELKTAIARLPTNLAAFGPYGYVLRGDAKVRLGSYDDAQEDFLQALKLDPKSAIAHWAYAGLLERQGRKDDARSEIRSLLTYHPSYVPALVSSRHF